MYSQNILMMTRNLIWKLTPINRASQPRFRILAGPCPHNTVVITRYRYLSTPHVFNQLTNTGHLISMNVNKSYFTSSDTIAGNVSFLYSFVFKQRSGFVFRSYLSIKDTGHWYLQDTHNTTVRDWTTVIWQPSHDGHDLTAMKGILQQ
jgi:hypothetical protein